MFLSTLIGLLFSISSKVPYETPKVEAAELTTQELQAIAMANATAYHLTNEEMRDMLATITCESHWKVNAIGDGGDSYGIAQINLPAHATPMEKSGVEILPAVTGVEALNPFFALDWTAKAFSLGKARMWTCYRNLH